MPPLSPRELLLLAILAAALIALLSQRVRADLVALLVMVGLGFGEFLAPGEMVAGFANPVVVTIGALYVITAALERTGVVAWIAGRLAAASGGSERRLVVLFTVSGALLSLAMINVAAVAILLPAAVGAARLGGVRESRLLLPLAYGVSLGGGATLFTSANLIVSGSLREQGERALTLLDFLPLGGGVALAGLAFLLLVGPRLLPERDSLVGSALTRPDLAAAYRLSERLWEVRLLASSPLVGQALATTVIGTRLGVTVVALLREHETLLPPDPATELAADDVLLVLGREERVRQLELEGTVVGQGAVGEGFAGSRLPVRLTEVVVRPRSTAVGQTLKELRFRQKFGMTALALWRGGRSYRTDVGDFALQSGDALLMVGAAGPAAVLAREPGFIVLHSGEAAPAELGRKGLLAALITLAVLLVSTSGRVPISEAMLSGAALLVLTGCLGMDDVYRAIEWRTLLIIAGLMPLGAALVSTGLAVRLSEQLGGALSGGGAIGLAGGLYLLSAGLTQAIGGQVAALILGPIAVSTARAVGVDPPTLAVVVAIGCAAAFLTPISHPVNLLIMAPGGYQPRDYARLGIGLLAVCFLALLLLLPLLTPL
ncbi:MAG: potassium transporter peripheral membrane component [Acidobacteria bacterium ADurb.Bin051]|nr:MAG: potassium transporter peripheral membrane component [Acidobacteria bacterium ADurb.Bin051]